MNFLARQAARDIRKLLLLRDCEVVGVAWGRMLHCLWRQLDDLAGPRRWRATTNYTFFPTVGIADQRQADERYQLTALESPEIASQFQRIANGAPPAHNVQPFFPPAFVTEGDMPKGISLEDFKQWWRNRGAFRKIFSNGPQSLIRKADAIICAMGSAELQSRFILDYFGSPSKAESKRHRALFLGNIGQVLLPKPDLSEAMKKEAEGITQRLIGATKEEVFAVARRAAERPDGERIPGVIACAATPSRAPSTIQACREGLISHLFIDKATSDAVCELLRDPNQKPQKLLYNQQERRRRIFHSPHVPYLKSHPAAVGSSSRKSPKR